MVRPLKNRPHFRLYASGEFFQKNSANTTKKLGQISRFESVIFSLYRSLGSLITLIPEAGSTSGLRSKFYPAAFGRIFIPLNTLKADCLNHASMLFFMIVVNRARLALS